VIQDPLPGALDFRPHFPLAVNLLIAAGGAAFAAVMALLAWRSPKD